MSEIYWKIGMVIVSSILVYAWMELRHQKKIKDADKQFNRIMESLAKKYDEKKDDSNS